MLGQILKKISNADGDVETHLSDLLVLLGYLSVGIYGGGYQYVSSYNAFFALPVKADPGSLTTFAVFLESVVLGQSMMLSLCFVLIFVLIIAGNFVFRNAFKAWFAYLAICTLAFGTISLCAFLGAFYGAANAKTDVSPESRLPKITISRLGKPECGSIPAAGDNAHLLFLDEKFIYYFTPVSADNSEILIDSVSVTCVSGIQLRKTGG